MILRSSSRLRISALLALASSLLAASCASAPPPEPTVVVVPSGTSSMTQVAEDPRALSSGEAQGLVDIINDRFLMITPDGPEQTVALEAGGRVVKRVAEDRYEEDFYLKDMIRAEYEYEEDWPNPHVARVFLRKNGITRWRRGDDDWTISTIPHVSFVFATRKAAADVVLAFRTLARH